MCHLRSVTSLGIEERKVLTFWKKSEEVKRVIWKSGGYFIVFVLLLTVISILLAHSFDRQIEARLFNMPTEEISQSTKIFVLIGECLVYFIFSVAFIGYRLARFLKKNIDRIAAMDIEPWPADKPYAPSVVPFLNRPERTETSPSYYDVLYRTRIDSKIPFTWPAFLKIMAFVTAPIVISIFLEQLFKK